MKQIILALMLAVAGIGAAVAANPIREGNMISGHVLVKGSEENIPYATVLIVGSGQGTVSNEEVSSSSRTCRRANIRCAYPP